MTKLTILIPTMNRPEFLRRTLQYYSAMHCDYKFIVGDASIGKMARENERICKIFNAQYYPLPNTEVPETIKELSEYVTTPYVALLPDDDLFIPATVDRIINFLDKSNDHIAGNGLGIGFELNQSGAYGKIRDLGDYTQRGIYCPTPLGRFNELAEKYFVLLFAIHRIDAWKKCWAHVGQTRDIGINGEMIPCFMSAVLGKTYQFNELYLIRQFHDRRITHIDHKQWIKSKDYELSSRTFMETLSQHVPYDVASDFMLSYTKRTSQKKVKRFKCPLRIPFLSALKIAHLDKSRAFTLSKLRTLTHPNFLQFWKFEQILKEA